MNQLETLNAENTHFTADDAREFVSKLKPMEIECLWEAMVESDTVQKKFDDFYRISEMLSELEERILELKDANNEFEYEFKKFIKGLKNE